MRKLSIILSCLFIAITAFAQEDAYHQVLRAQLQETYGVTGGDFIISETETGFYSKLSTTSVSKKMLDAESTMIFSKIIDLTIPNFGNNAWDNAVRAVTTKKVSEGDVLLWVVWFKGIEATEGFGHVTNVFEMTGDPYTKSLSFGGDLANEWQQWFIPFEAATDYEVGKGRFQLNLGLMEGHIQIAGAAILNFGDAYEKQDLPASDYHLNYAGREDGAQWRIDALNRIEQIRKGEMNIKVVNKNGDPVKGADVQINMVRHWFGFGTAVNIGWWFKNDSDADIYLEKIENLLGDGRTFGVVVFENGTKWGPWEDDSHLGTRDDIAEFVDWLKSYGIRVRGHNLVWPRWSSLPSDMNENQDDLDYLTTRIQEHIAEEAGWDGLQGVIDEWDVINEMVHCKDLEDLYGDYDCYVDWVNWADEADPNAILYINEYSIINGGGIDKSSQQAFKDILQYILDAGAPLEGLGIQGHMGTSFTPPAKIIEILDGYEQFNLDMSITEYDASGAPPELGADYMRDMLIASFAQPGMRNFLMWGFWDGAHWNSDAPLFYKDWSLKPSGEAFIEWVFDKWWTSESGNSLRNGSYSTRAFYGTYDVDVEFNGVKGYAGVEFNPGFDEEIVVTLNTDVTDVEESSVLPNEFEILENYPNPFNPTTTIRYALPQNAFVEMNIYDSNGRWVQNLVNGRQQAGRHAVEFNAENLCSGVYMCRMSANGHTDVQKLMLVK